MCQKYIGTAPNGIIAASMKTKRLRPITFYDEVGTCIGINALSIHIRAIKAMSSVRIDIYTDCKVDIRILI